MAYQIRKTEYFSSNANAEVCNTVVTGVCVCVCVCSLKKWRRKEVLTACDVSYVR